MIGEIRQNFTEASASVGLILAKALNSYPLGDHIFDCSERHRKKCRTEILLEMITFSFIKDGKRVQLELQKALGGIFVFY